MNDHEFSVGGALNVDLNQVGTLVRSCAEGGEGVLGSRLTRAAMRSIDHVVGFAREGAGCGADGQPGDQGNGDDDACGATATKRCGGNGEGGRAHKISLRWKR